MSATQIKIEATIAATPQKVWTYWTRPEHITKWNFASPDWHCPRATVELKVGGKYCARMEAKDGSFGFDFDVIFDEVTELKRLSYTMEDGRKVTTNFQSQGNSTLVTTLFDAEKENSVELQRNGWQAILNNFKTYVEKH
jgi:uncharacterized protein YndB with AHSA1/START domain